jgi:C1A family cysteine protease
MTEKKVKKTQHHYGWRMSPPDAKDALYAFDETTLVGDIPAEVDPRGTYMPPVYDQGDLGSCTANAVAAATQADMHIDGMPYDKHRPARLLVYWMERKIEGDLGQGDTGAFGRDGFKAIQTMGWVAERDYKYVTSKYADTPSSKILAEALAQKYPKQYGPVAQTQSAIQAALANKQTVAFGFTVYDSFEASDTMSSGIVPMPNTAREQVLGGHETLIVGYLQSHPGYALVRNSWGKDVYTDLDGANEYGGGYFLMPWAYITNPSLASDFRTWLRPQVS